MHASVRAALWALMWASTARAEAQDSTTALARVGDRVRIWTGGGRPREGVLRQVARDTVFVGLPGRATAATPRDAVTRVQVHGGRSLGAGAKRGAKVGAIVGGLAGLYLAFGDSGCYSNGEEVPCPSQLQTSTNAGERAFIVMVAAGLGALAGSAVGTAFPAPTWRDARLPPAGASPMGDAGCAGPRVRAVALPVADRPSCDETPARVPVPLPPPV